MSAAKGFAIAKTLRIAIFRIMAIATLALVALKLLEAGSPADMSWWLVFTPVYIWLGFKLLAATVAGLGIALLLRLNATDELKEVLAK